MVESLNFYFSVLPTLRQMMLFFSLLFSFVYSFSFPCFHFIIVNNFRNIYCGMLHCKHLNERLEFGMESVAILSHSFINSGGSIIPCRTAIVDLGLNQVDPGLAPDGAKCGEGKVIYNLFIYVLKIVN